MSGEWLKQLGEWYWHAASSAIAVSRFHWIDMSEHSDIIQ